MGTPTESFEDLIEFELGTDGALLVVDDNGEVSGGDSNDTGAIHEFDDEQEYFILQETEVDGGSIEGLEEHLLENEPEIITDDIVVFDDQMLMHTPKSEPESDIEEFQFEELVNNKWQTTRNRTQQQPRRQLQVQQQSTNTAPKQTATKILTAIKKEKNGLKTNEIKPETVSILNSTHQEQKPATTSTTALIKPRMTNNTTVEDDKEQLSKKTVHEHKGPLRYMLFDDLIANIVDFDIDDTPIVEFSMSTSKLDERLPIECGICPEVMHRGKLHNHLKTHLVPETNRYACIYCDESYRDCKYLAGHARRHMGIRPYVCEECKLYFSTKQDLRVHNQRRHLEKEHTCELCGKNFAQNTQLKRHRESTHEKKRRYACPHCPKAYYKNFSLQEHIRNVHMGKRRMLVCPFCGMQCRDAHKMARHRKDMHLNQSVFVCQVCREEFTDIKYFDAHKRSIQCRSNTRRKKQEEEEGTGGTQDVDIEIGDVDFDEALIDGNYEEESMMVESLVEEEEEEEDEDTLLDDTEDFNSDELICEVTLEGDIN